MAFNFTKEQIAKCAPRNKNAAELYEALSQVLPKYDINTPERVAAFMAQCGHESVDFSVLRENLNYSAKGGSVGEKPAGLADLALSRMG